MAVPDVDAEFLLMKAFINGRKLFDFLLCERDDGLQKQVQINLTTFIQKQNSRSENCCTSLSKLARTSLLFYPDVSRKIVPTLSRIQRSQKNARPEPEEKTNETV